MVKDILFVTLLFTASFVNGQVVQIPDENFQQFLIYDLLADDNKDGKIQLSEAQLVTGILDCSKKEIKDLTGIEAFTSIAELNCSENELTGLDISKNVRLKRLLCSDNQISQLNLSVNTELQLIWCGDNPLVNIDVSNNTKLESFRIKNAGLQSLNLSKNTRLNELLCSDNPLGDIDVSSNIYLIDLKCDNTNLTSIELSKNIALELLSCTNNSISHLTIPEMEYLKSLDCRGNQMKTLDLSGCPYLEFLDCSDNELTDLKLNVLKLISHETMGGRSIFCSKNKIKILDVRNIWIRKLHCSHNNLEQIFFSRGPGYHLDEIDCSYNQLKELDLSVCVNISRIVCNNNQLKSIDLRNGKNEQMKSINFLANPDLTCISVDDEFLEKAVDWAVADPDDWFQSDIMRASFAKVCY